MAGRYIGENTRMINDVLHVTKERNISGLLLLIDFEIQKETSTKMYTPF